MSTKRPLGMGFLVAAIAAFIAGCVTLSTALEKSASIVNDPVIVTLVVNGFAIVLFVIALYLLARTRGLVGASLAALAWVGVSAFLLHRGLDANAAKLFHHWDEERSVQDLGRICEGSLAMNEHARTFDANATQHELVLFEKGPQSSHVFAKPSLTIGEADLLACADRVEKTVETCDYEDQIRRGSHVSVHRIQVSTHVRFIAIKTGEQVWETTVDGSPPRACDKLEQARSIVGSSPNVQGIYQQHFMQSML